MLCLQIRPAGAASPHVTAEAWLGAWGFPASSFVPSKVPATVAVEPPADFDQVTVRQIVRISQAATRIRIKLSNEFGDSALAIGGVHVALLAAGADTVPGSDHTLTFSQHESASIAPNAPLLSDPVDWKLPALTRLAVSIYLPGRSRPPAHRVTEYVSAPGNFLFAEHMTGVQTVRSGALVSEVEIVSPVGRRVVVTFGDSITEGFGATLNEFRGWSDRLAERLTSNRATRDWSVVNAGINSNRLLHDGPGTGALARLDRDALGIPGVAAIILLEGINDIGYGHTVPQEAVSAADIIAAYRQILSRAHAHAIAVIAGTITPYQDAHYYAPEGEALRLAVNEWIRDSGAFDAVIDFDAAMRDPAHPAQMNPALQRGDHLHPNDAGYAAMAEAVDLALLIRISRAPRP